VVYIEIYVIIYNLIEDLHSFICEDNHNHHEPDDYEITSHIKILGA